MKRLLRLGQLIDKLNDRVGIALSWVVLLMTLIGVFNAVTRKLSQTIGIDLSSNAYIETQWYLFSLVFLWGGGYALRHGVHVRVDILYSRLSTRGKAWIDIMGNVLFLTPLCLLILWVSIPYAMDSWHVMEQSPDPSGLPRYLIKSAIPVAFVLLLLQALAQLVRDIARVRGLLDEEQEQQSEGAL